MQLYDVSQYNVFQAVSPKSVCLLCWYKTLNTQRGSADVHKMGEECEEQWADGIQASLHPVASDGGQYLGHISL